MLGADEIVMPLPSLGDLGLERSNQPEGEFRLAIAVRFKFVLHHVDAAIVAVASAPST